ncbi:MULTISPECIES: OmpP1/FadL family transporter [Candidatus Ichthyocystis]|uniref:Putative long-chain fatty acid outer membrane transporter n=1 Tax=Candidatus Ichthyocystis hellenicum TaxID=1561003 RepID=A0A0S4M0V1_9BURK|nr:MULTISPECIES: outer membrane protein transport protein [Ichthyocystis]CUT17415.1 putative long-chain fatty acid outer membrane transporter [Candidatus Ichthyocystis hellenicum]
MIYIKRFASAVFLLLICFVYAERYGYASGFSLYENTSTLEGMAIAGVAAVPDVGVVFFNPAAASFLPKSKQKEIAIGGHYIRLNLLFKNDGSKQPGFPPISPLPTESEGAESSSSAFIPNISVSFPLSKDMVGGIFLGVPFGLSTDYGDRWVGRYYATLSDVKSFLFNPFLSLRVNPHLSFALGFNVLYFQPDLEQQINLSEAIAQSLSKQVGRTLSSLCTSALPSQYKRLQTYVDLVCTGRGNAKSSFSGSVFSTGWNAGVMYQPVDSWRFGLSYRQGYSLQVNGVIGITDFDPNFAIFQGLSPADGPASLKSRSGKAHIDLPNLLDISAFHKINDRFDISLDIRRQGWSKTKYLVLSDSIGDVRSVFLDARTTWGVHVGGQYLYSDNVTLRSGLFLEQGFSSRDERYLLPRLPDTDRLGLACGATYSVSPASNLSVSMLYVTSISSAKIAADVDRISFGILKGSFDAHAWAFSAQYIYDF